MCCTRTTAASRPSASIAVRPVGPALLEISAKVSTRPLASVTMPDQRIGARQRSGLGAQPPGRRAAGVGVEEAVGQRAAAAGDRQQVHQRPQLRLVGARGGVDDLVEGLGGQPIVDGQPAGVHQRARHRCRSWRCRARRAPRARRRRSSAAVPCAAATSRPIDSAITLSELFIISRSRSISGGDCTDAISLPPSDADGQHRDGGRVDAQRDGQRAAGVERGRPGPARVDADRLGAAAVEHHRLHRRDVAAVDVERIPARRHRRSAVGADVHLHRGHVDAAAPHLVGQVADPRRVAVPGVLPGGRRRQRRVAAALEHDDAGLSGRPSPVVVSRASRSRASSAAAVVSTLFVDAGCIGTSAPCAHSCAPVMRVGDPAGQRAQVRVGQQRRQRRGQPVGRRLGRGVGDGHDRRARRSPAAGAGLTAWASLVRVARRRARRPPRRRQRPAAAPPPRSPHGWTAATAWAA